MTRRLRENRRLRLFPAIRFRHCMVRSNGPFENAQLMHGIAATIFVCVQPAFASFSIPKGRFEEAQLGPWISPAPLKEIKMLNVKRQTAAPLVRMAAGVILSVVLGTSVALAAHAKGEHAYAAPGARQQDQGSLYEGPLQDPRDAWDGYFANPEFNPNYHGSNGG